MIMELFSVVFFFLIIVDNIGKILSILYSISVCHFGLKKYSLYDEF